MSALLQVGRAVERVDGADKVTGQAVFGADVRLPGMLYGRVLRAPHPHARVVRIDTRRAEALPGVLAVITADDLPSLKVGESTAMGEVGLNVVYLADMVLCRGRVRWKGHPVAAVAAVSPHIAEEALQLIDVEYEVLEPVVDVLQAMEPGSPLVHDDLYTNLGRGQRSQEPSNVGTYLRIERGDLEAGWAAADVVVEREFRTRNVHQGYIEPQACVAQATADGRVTIWTTTQGAFAVRDQVSQLLQIPAKDIKVVPTEVGGAFGGKHYPYLEPLATMLSRKSGRPVKLVMSRAEVFEGTGPTPGSVIRVKMGANREGKLTAAYLWLAYDAGAYPGSAVGAAAITGLAPYVVPHVRVEGYDVVTNKPRVGAYRAPGATQVAFAVEQVIDELAQQVGLDPVTFRLRNAAREGTVRHDGYQYRRIGLVEMLEAVKAHPHWQAPLPEGRHVGRGFAVGYWFNGQFQSTCQIAVNPDGSVSLGVGNPDLSGARTAVVQIVAEELGLTTDKIRMQILDTSTAPPTDSTGGSRNTYTTGLAAYRAAVAVREEMKRRAAQLLEASPEDVEWAGGEFRIKGAPSRRLTWQQVAAQQRQTGGPINLVESAGGGGDHPSFSAALCDVEVDPDTGHVKILRWTAFQDVGRAIHPVMVEGQMQGGTVQGIGWALMEEYVWDQGVMLNPNFLDYRLPTALDVPDIDTHYVEVPEPNHPYGVRGIGEAPIVPPPAAIANAIHRATGVRVTELPMTPERVWQALAQA